MNSDTNKLIHSVVSEIVDNYKSSEIFMADANHKLPNKDTVIEIIKDIRRLVFPSYFSEENLFGSVYEYFAGNTLSEIYNKLKTQSEIAILYSSSEASESASKKAEELAGVFIKKLPYIQQMLLKDIEAGFNGDPAAKSREEIVFSYPGLFAVFVYRIAHELYNLGLPFIPRIMTEYAHSRTGIDINSGAVIGEYFFIDHGTGVVIGETTIIGDHVKLYQGVTLGALSTKHGQQLAGLKRHPTIENNVTIYSNATILGGETVIGEDSVIGGNAFIIKSVPPGTRVSAKNN